MLTTLSAIKVNGAIALSSRVIKESEVKKGNSCCMK